MEQMNMMPNGMMAQGQPGMQRPQPGNPGQQVHAQIMMQLKNKLPMFNGSWQSTYDIRDRAVKVFQIYTQLCLIENNSSKCFLTALNYEQDTITRSHNKDAYQQQIMKKLNDINTRRQQTAPNLATAMGNQPRMNMNNPNAPPMHVNMNGMPNAMQRSDMMPNSQPATLDPAALTSMPMQPQMSNSGNRQQPRMNMTPNPSQLQHLQQPSAEQIQKHAQITFQNLPEERKNAMRNHVFRNMSEQQRQQYSASGKDPLVSFLLNKSREQLLKQNMPMNTGQGPTGGQGGPFDFSAIMGQQANALKLQESGEQVVPASNNNNNNPGFTAQMNTPNPQAGGINPAMLRNNQGGPGQGPNGPGPADVGQIMLERERQRQAQMQSTNMRAQQQAMMQAQMNGQAGALNAPNALTGAAGGSPAMSMLNRPMQPPGSQPPSTPQQPNRAPNMQPPNQANQRPGQIPNGNANAILQHHQNMLNQNSAAVNMQGRPGGMPMLDPQNPNYGAFLQGMPQAAQEKIRNMQPNEVAGLFNTMARRNGPQNMRDMSLMGNNRSMNPMPDLQPHQPMQGHPMQMPPNVNPAQFQGQMPQQQQSQVPPQNVPRALGNLDIKSIPLPLKNQILLSRRFPDDLPQQLGIVAPPGVHLWGELNKHIEDNARSLPNGTHQKFMNAMMHYFNDHPDELRSGLQQVLIAKQHAQNRQNNMGTRGGTMNATPMVPNMPITGQSAPIAQMVPPNPQGGQPPGQGQPGPPQQINISNEELLMFRERYPRFANADDDAARTVIRNFRARAMQHQQQQQQALRQQQMAKAGVPEQAGRAGPQQPVNRTPMPNNATQKAPPMAQSTGQKRPQPPPSANDDVMEIPNPNAPNNSGAQQAPKMRPSNSQQQNQQASGNTTTEQVNQAANQGDIARMEAIRRANAGAASVRSSAPDPSQNNGSLTQNAFMMPKEDEKNRVSVMMEEARRTVVKGPPVQIDQASKAAATGLLKRLYKPFNDVDKTFAVALRLGFDEKRIQNVMRAKFLIFYNWDDKNDSIKEPLSVTMHQLQQIHLLIQNYLNEMKTTKEKAVMERNRQAQEAAKNQKSAAAKPTANQPSADPPATLKHSRKASSHKVPTAPTDNKHFDWSMGAPSPHGVPNYHLGRSDLTPDKLNIPPNKRRRTGQDSAAATPVGQVVTPGAPGASPNPANLAKTSSPEQLRKTQAAVGEAKKGFTCPKDTLCVAAVQGFETEEELTAHVKTEHKPIEDPMKFFLDSAAQALEVDAASGQPLPAKAGAKKAPAKASAPPMKRENSNTPGIKTEIRTPAAGMAATPGSASKLPAKDKKEPAPKTLAESMAEKMGFPAPATDNRPLDALLDVDTDTNAGHSWMRNLQATFSNSATDNIDTDLFDLFGQDVAGQQEFTEDWGFDLPPAALANDGVHDSPSGSDTTPKSQSSRGSDISANDRLMLNLSWDAFGEGDAAGVFSGFGDMGIDNGAEEATEGAEKTGGEGLMADAGDFDWRKDFSLGDNGFNGFTREDFVDSGDSGMEFEFDN